MQNKLHANVKNYLAVLILATGLPFASAQAQQDEPPEFPYPEVIQKAVLDFFVPVYEQVVIKAEALDRDMIALCDAPGKDGLSKVREGFANMVDAWSRAEAVQFGPVGNMGRRERILFWPDRKGIGARQYRRILKQRDATAIDPETLARKSVAVQGLPALERILFDKSATQLETTGDKSTFRCAFGKAISANVVLQAKKVLAEWDRHPSYAEQMIKPGPHNPHFHDSNNSAATLVSTFSYALEVFQDVKLRPGMGKSVEKAKPKKTPWRRSGLGLNSLTANLEALQSLYELSGIGDVLPDNEKWIDKGIRADFAKSLKLLQGIKSDLATAVTDPAQRKALKGLVAATDNLQLLLGTEIPRAHGIVLGFVWVDGD